MREEAAGDGEVFLEMQQLVSIPEIAVEDQRRSHAEQGEPQREGTAGPACQQRQPAADL